MSDNGETRFYDLDDVARTEAAVVKLFARHADGAPEIAAMARCGVELAPAFMRALATEINLDTDPEAAHRGLRRVLAWMLAETLIGAPDDAVRVEALKEAVTYVAQKAFEIIHDEAAVPTGAGGRPVAGGRQ